ncbi:transposase [Paraphaeosphaeria minitans]|uniref:Transposase n=1 Tax=Paraphaeosphaeria minitans TaxID=565426 RepID=A0A9P6G5Y0_9PLEO|nr:transposase [Paraphaeosphaeria minitans]
MVFPSHSTHTLQPLDVSIFGPLSSYYSSELSRQQQRSHGLLPVVKADFYGLFKSAYASSFTAANIMAAFEATGIWPIDRTPVTTKFNYTTPPEQIDQIGSSHLSPADWKRTQRLLEQVVKDNNDVLVRKLTGAIHRASVQNKLLQLENEGSLTSLNTKNKRTKRGRRLPLNKQEAREKREIDKLVREKEKAEKAAKRELEKQQKNSEKALQTSQKGKRKASKALPKPKKRQKRSSRGGPRGGRSDEPMGAPSPTPARVTQSGRSVNLPSKFR